MAPLPPTIGKNRPVKGVLSYFAESLKFSKLLSTQKKLVNELRSIRESIVEDKSNDPTHKRRLQRDSEDAAKKLDDLGKSFEKLGLEFLKSEDIIKEMELRAKLSEKGISKEIARQTREDLKSLSKKKVKIASSYQEKTRQWEIFQLRYWGLTGRAIKWITGISGSALFIKGWKDFYDSGISAQEQQLQTVGKLNEGLGSWSGEAANFASVKSLLKGTLRAYGVKSGDYEYLTRQYIAMSREHTETSEFFSKLGAIARVSNTDTKDLWERTKSRSRNLGKTVEEVANETLDIVRVLDETTGEMDRQSRESGETKSALGIFREDWMKSIMEVSDEIERAGGFANQVTIAKLFAKGVEAGNRLKMSFSGTLKLSKTYAKLLKLDEVFNFQLGLKVINDIDEAVEKRSIGLSALERDRVVEEVVMNKFGARAKVSALSWYKIARQGGYMTAAGNLGTLYAQTDEGMVEAASFNYDLIKYGSDVYGASLLEGAGASKAEAITAVVAIKSTHMELLTESQKEMLLGKGYQKGTEESAQAYRESVLKGAKSVFGTAWQVMTSVFGNPLVKMAAGLGVLAYTFRKEIRDSIGLVHSFREAASSILRWGGKSEAAAVSSNLQDLKGLFTKGRMKKAGLIGAGATVAGLGLTYGVGRYFSGSKGDEGEKEDKKNEATLGNKLLGETRTPFGTELGERIGSVRPSPPSAVPNMLPRDIGIDNLQADKVATQIRSADVAARSKALEKAAVAELGGRYVRTPEGKETVEVTIPGFVQGLIPRTG